MIFACRSTGPTCLTAVTHGFPAAWPWHRQQGLRGDFLGRSLLQGREGLQGSARSVEIGSSVRSMVLAGTKRRMLWSPEICPVLCSEPCLGTQAHKGGGWSPGAPTTAGEHELMWE